MWCSIRWTARGRVGFSALCDRAGCWLQQQDRHIGSIEGALSHHGLASSVGWRVGGWARGACARRHGRRRSWRHGALLRGSMPQHGHRWEWPERGSEIGGVHRLGEVGVSPPIERGLNGACLTVERADDDPRPRRDETERGDGVEPLLKRHLDLEDDEIRVKPVHQLDRRGPAVRLCDLRWRHGTLQEMTGQLAPLASGVDHDGAHVGEAVWAGFRVSPVLATPGGIRPRSGGCISHSDRFACQTPSASKRLDARPGSRAAPSSQEGIPRPLKH
jgi:hypothetical protein